MTENDCGWPRHAARNLAAFKHEAETPMRGHNEMCCRLVAENADLRQRIADLESAGGSQCR